MPKLYCRYGTMKAGKTETLLNILYDYEVNHKFRAIVMKPNTDTREQDSIYSRTGRKRKVDITLFKLEDAYGAIATNIDLYGVANVVLVDEAQFLTAEHIKQLHEVAHRLHVSVICFGIRVDVFGNPFEGMSQLFAMADEIEEIGTKTLCHCGKLATMHLRYVDTVVDTGGSQIVVDDAEACDGLVSYDSVCSDCWLETFNKARREKVEIF